MKSNLKIIIGGVAVLLLIVGAFALLNGWIPVSSKDTHPPCEQLPTIAEATEALETNQSFAKEIEGLGDGIVVEAGQPCSNGQDRGLVMVSYDSKSERDAIRNLLTNSEGFGVPVYLVKR